MVAPGIGKLLEHEVAYLEQANRIITENRWAGSVNAVYYGVQRTLIDEKRLGAIGAVILAAVTQMAFDNPMQESMSLKRVAN